MKHIRKLVPILLIVVMILTMTQGETVSAATKYITVESFITKVVKGAGIKVNKKEDSPYIQAAIREGIIKEKEFTNLGKNITRTDASVIIVRADEYLHGVTISDELVATILEKRLSDINLVKVSKQSYVAKCYALGFIKGYSNGSYTTNREFRGSKKLTLSGATDMIKMLKDKRLRGIVAPDGQLTRTTNLPSNAKLYPYILASYPNAYYDWEFYYMKWFENGVNCYTSGISKNLKDYASPKEVKKIKYLDWVKDGETFQKVIDTYGDLWTEKVKEYVTLAFNINYKTIKKDKDWYDRIVELDNQYGWLNQKGTEETIDKYMDDVINNRTIMEASVVACDKSTLYYSDGCLILRVYVRYRINSSLDNSQVRISPLAFTKSEYSDYEKVVLGKWRNGYYDVSLGGNGSADINPNTWGIDELMVSDYYYAHPVLK